MLSQPGTQSIGNTGMEQRETENQNLKRELEVLKPELQLIKSEVDMGVIPDSQTFLM